jgi:DNA-directed RNA polymerase specialized sigma24 family protein
MEMSINETAVILNVNPRSVRSHITKYGLWDFVQPQKKKDEWRERCRLRKKLTFDLDQKKLVQKYTEIWYHKLRNDGSSLSKKEIASEAFSVLLNAIDNNRHPDMATFETYYRTCIANKMRDIMSAMREDAFLFADVDVDGANLSD